MPLVSITIFKSIFCLSGNTCILGWASIMFPGHYMNLLFLFHCHQYSLLLWGSLSISGILCPTSINVLRILSQLLLILSEMFLTAYAAYVKCSRIFYSASVRFSKVIFTDSLRISGIFCSASKSISRILWQIHFIFQEKPA